MEGGREGEREREGKDNAEECGGIPQHFEVRWKEGGGMKEGREGGREGGRGGGGEGGEE